MRNNTGVECTSMSDGVAIDIGAALPQIENRILTLFTKDRDKRDRRARLSKLLALSAEQAKWVQCIGMPRPIALNTMYQPVTLNRVDEQGSLRAEDVLSGWQDAVVHGGPGWGKTTLMQWVYLHELRDAVHLPVFIPLRNPGALDDLKWFVDGLIDKDLDGHKNKRKETVGMAEITDLALDDADAGVRGPLLLLVDGYDEISYEQRVDVSNLLRWYCAQKKGVFWLTCRSHYELINLPATRYEVGPFTHAHAAGFVRAFLIAYRSSLDPEILLSELVDRGFDDFIAHPLMLSLVCILKTSANVDIPRRTIGLIRRAIEILSFRWDEAKGISRQSKIPLDSEERIRCLMRIAYDMKKHQAEVVQIEYSIREHLKLVQSKSVNPSQLLEEMAQWFGLLVPIDCSLWHFSHKSIHDYLAARYWVENGGFTPTAVPGWDARAAYACCLLPNATTAIKDMLRRAESIGPFLECLSNRASFDPSVIAEALVVRVGKTAGSLCRLSQSIVTVVWPENVLYAASGDFLYACVRIGDRLGQHAGEIVALSAMAELFTRGERTPIGNLDSAIKKIYLENPSVSVIIGENRPLLISDLVQA